MGLLRVLSAGQASLIKCVWARFGCSDDFVMRTMETYFGNLLRRAATIDELVSDDFTALSGQKGEADMAAKRLAAWCKSCASGDWLMFGRRLKRDDISIDEALARFATVRRSIFASTPKWVEHVIWIAAALGNHTKDPSPTAPRFTPTPRAFEHLLIPVVEEADARLWASVEAPIADNLSASARAHLRQLLVDDLSSLCAAAIYARFVKARDAAAKHTDAADPQPRSTTLIYEQFIADMKAGGFQRLFEEKPVLLRLMASTTQQWLEAAREFVTRLHTDLAAIRRNLIHSDTGGLIEKIEGHLSDPHHGGRSVLIVEFQSGSRVLYKPKDLRLDTAWYALIEELNRAGAPIKLQAMRVLARHGYGWTEYVKHAGCDRDQGFPLFFRRAGAWLALFHCFAATDMHHENMIAAGDQPIPIDLETILQAPEDQVDEEAEVQAFQVAKNVIANSVMAVGLLPAYGRSADNDIFQVGGIASDWSSKIRLGWNNINTDTMRPVTVREAGTPTSNLPHVNGQYAKLGDYIEDLISGFEEYARFLAKYDNDGKLFDRFVGLPARKVVRPTQFYYMLLQRLKDDRTMHDGVLWSAQADFLARLADWEKDYDPHWPLQRSERAALLELNVPYFVSTSDRNEISDAASVCVRTQGKSGLERARARLRGLDEQEIAWQIEVVRQNASSVSTTNSGASISEDPKLVEHLAAPSNDIFLAEADRVAEEVSRHAIRRGPSAAWIGQSWLSGSEVSQLAVLGHDLYSGTSGMAVFLAAHALVRKSATSSNLALASLSDLRRNLKGRNAAGSARLWGIGGATGLGSIIYGLAVTAKLLHYDELLEDAHRAAELFTDDLIAADKQLDVIGGSAGAILGLLRLHRDSPSDRILKLAEKCGEHLLAQPRIGRQGARSWTVPGPHSHPLNGMSHGAAGFALALASLAAATGRRDFANAASECIAFENISYNAEHKNWPDFREAEPHWRSQWCHGAVGIGLARVAMQKIRNPASDMIETDVRNALAGASAKGWRAHYDTLCCGSLGNVEFICEAGKALEREDLCELASRRLASILESTGTPGDYRWSGGDSRHNLGLFRGLAGVGYTCLRRVTDDVLPNILVWE